MFSFSLEFHQFAGPTRIVIGFRIKRLMCYCAEYLYKICPSLNCCNSAHGQDHILIQSDCKRSRIIESENILNYDIDCFALKFLRE